ncbi:MAG: ABC transporter permease [Rhizobiaceae bacterium]
MTSDASGGSQRSGPRVEVSAESVPSLALKDLLKGIQRPELWNTLALHDIRQRFRRSILGPFWITLSMGILVAALSLVFGALFGQDLHIFMPYLATGLIFWTFLTATINEGCESFINSESFVRNVPVPVSSHFFRMFQRNVIVWLHNMAIYVLVILIFQYPLNWNLLLFIPGLALFLANLMWMSLLAAVISTRFRDIPQLISSLLQVVFYLTPILWSADQFPERPFFVAINPAYHLMEVARAPLLGEMPGLLSWAVAILMVPLGATVTIMLYRRAYPRIAYWV